jgi:hypothetical protein
MKEYRFLLIAGDPTVHSMPRFVLMHGENLEDAVQKFAQEHNLSVDAIENDKVWFVRRDDGTAHKYSVGCEDE